MKYEVSTD